MAKKLETGKKANKPNDQIKWIGKKFFFNEIIRFLFTVDDMNFFSLCIEKKFHRERVNE